MSRRARRLTGLLIAATALAAPAVARAELPLELSWEAPAECPSGATVRAELERVVRARRGRTPPRLVARARIEQQPDGRWHLHLRTQRDGIIGDRRLEAGSCASLVGAATLVIGLAFGEGVEIATDTLGLEPRSSSPPAPPPRPRHESAPPVEAAAPPPPPPAEPEPPPPPVPETAALIRQTPPPPAPEPMRPLPLRWSLSLDGRSAWGPMPGQAFGVGVGLDVGGQHWSINVRGIALPPSESTVMSDARARFASYGGALSGCLRAAVEVATVSGCAGLQLTAMRSQSVGALQDYVEVAPLYAAVPALRVDVPVYRALSVSVGFEFPVALHRPIFAIRELGDVYQVPRVAPTLVVGLSARL